MLNSRVRDCVLTRKLFNGYNLNCKSWPHCFCFCWQFSIKLFYVEFQGSEFCLNKKNSSMVIILIAKTNLIVFVFAVNLVLNYFMLNSRVRNCVLTKKLFNGYNLNCKNWPHCFCFCWQFSIKLFYVEFQGSNLYLNKKTL